MKPTEPVLLDALKSVIDPNTGKDLVSGKQLKNLQIEGGDVSFDVEIRHTFKNGGFVDSNVFRFFVIGVQKIVDIRR